jgi:cytochrome c-type biogenesis protein CcmH/NrfF
MLEWICESDGKERIQQNITHILNCVLMTNQVGVLEWLRESGYLSAVSPDGLHEQVLSAMSNGKERADFVKWYVTHYPERMGPDMLCEAIWNIPVALDILIAAGCPMTLSVCHEALKAEKMNRDEHIQYSDIIRRLREAGCPWV